MKAIHIPIVATCPVREAAGHRTEMTSQLLLGEKVEVLDTFGSEWLYIKSLHDGYEGWCQKIQMAALEEPEAPIAGYFSGNIGMANVNGEPMNVFKGTPIYESTLRAGVFTIGFTGLKHVSNSAETTLREVLREAAFSYLNTAYLWGGRTLAGIDCSGFAQMVYRQAGFHLLRDAHLQAGTGSAVGFLQEARCGDLAFFDEPDGRISHVGILLNDHEIIHASGKVRVDDIDHEGIYSRDQARRTHRLRVIRRYLE